MPRSNASTRLPHSGLSKAILVEVTNQFRGQRIDAKRLCNAVQLVLKGEGVKQADISLAIVDDPTISELNQRYLGHKGPTDVISFSLQEKARAITGAIDGEIVISAETAVSAAQRFGSSMADELLLYVIHGTLHLVGYDDLSAAKRKIMHRQERYYLSRMGIELPEEMPSKSASVPQPSAVKRKSKAKFKARS